MEEIKTPEILEILEDENNPTKQNGPETEFCNEIDCSQNSPNTQKKENIITPLEDTSTATTATAAVVAKEELGTNTPMIPLEVYQNLPAFLKSVVDEFDIPREKDIVLTSALAILSGCFNNVTGTYDRRNFYPNLYSFIIAPPASGKGVMSFAQQLAQKIHDSILCEYERIKNAGGDTNNIQRTHFIPADSSSAAVKRILAKNYEKGTICETEADTLSNTFLQDWGGYSDLLRKAFQHEPVSYSRNGKNEDVIQLEIKQPKLSVCLSGTPGQVPALLKSTENGLFSRFIFYIFKNSGGPTFKNVFDDKGNKDLGEYFQKLAVKLETYSSLVNSNMPIKFQFNEEQEGQFVIAFGKYGKHLYLHFGEETQSIVNRLGLITFRIAMILSLLRKLDQESSLSDLVCSEIDFASSMMLSEVYLFHAMAVFQLLDNRPHVNSTAIQLLDYLPEQFSNSEAVRIGKQSANISERSVNTYLAELKSAGLIKQPKERGTYTKAELQQ